ncbi:MAG: Ldh family oxidoreductase [Alphaproteobacteria bacterium]|nr:Ldh family oxidoreductase [Alphaproteobacteria bacterium]
MPIVQHDRLRGLIEKLLRGAGANEVEAETVSRHSVAANLAGHDSHGVIMIPTYINRVDIGHIVPGAPWEIKQETATSTVVDGNWGFGYVVSERATRLTIEKAKKSQVAATTIVQQSHIGRVAAYPLMAAREGMIAIMTADSGRGPKAVAPFGGREARLGTNPISIAVPSAKGDALVVDMATSAVAAGKVNLAKAKNAAIPEGWIVDGEGKPTTDPHQFGKGAVLLPLGGPEGHKGYSLAVMVEILSALLPGLGFGVSPTGRHNDGCFLACFNVEAFRPLETFKQEVAEFADYLKDTKPAAGFEEVLYPGEVELRTEAKRRAEGIPVDDTTWGKLKGLGEKYGFGDEFNV